MKRSLKKMIRNVIILIVISILLGSNLKISSESPNYYKIKMFYNVAILINLLPIAYFLRKFKQAKKSPVYFIGFVFYYLIILPIWVTLVLENPVLSDVNLGCVSTISLNITTGLNMLLLIVSQLFIIKYVFIDIISGRRKATNSDIGIVFLTYMTIGITFGFLYVVLIRNDSSAISGLLIKNHTELEIYFRSIYFSFITLTSVGYGDMLPISFLSQFLVIIESIMGVVIISFSLGIVFSSNLNAQEEEKEKEYSDEYIEMKKKLMKEFEKSLDKNIGIK